MQTTKLYTLLRKGCKFVESQIGVKAKILKASLRDFDEEAIGVLLVKPLGKVEFEIVPYKEGYKLIVFGLWEVYISPDNSISFLKQDEMGRPCIGIAPWGGEIRFVDDLPGDMISPAIEGPHDEGWGLGKPPTGWEFTESSRKWGNPIQIRENRTGRVVEIPIPQQGRDTRLPR
jgi:hypothetical protein